MCVFRVFVLECSPRTPAIGGTLILTIKQVFDVEAPQLEPLTSHLNTGRLLEAAFGQKQLSSD